jgi:hypothetical protein
MTKNTTFGVFERFCIKCENTDTPPEVFYYIRHPHHFSPLANVFALEALPYSV